MTIILFLTEEKIVSPASIPEYAAVILEIARKQMVHRFMTATRINCLPNKGDHRQKKKEG